MSVRDATVVGLSLAAAVLFALSNVVEQHNAQTAPKEQSLRIGLIVYLARRKAWLMGVAADVGGYICQAAALGLGLLVVVQPIGATGLLFSLGLDAAWTKRRMRVSEWTAAALLAASLGLFLAESGPSGGTTRVPFDRWVGPGIALVVVVGVCLVVAQRSSGTLRAALLALAAGTMFGITAPLTKAFVGLLGGGPVTVLTNWEPYGLAVFAIGGFVVLQSAFQAGALQASLPLLEITEPLVASLIGVALLHERLHAHGVADKVVIAMTIAVMLVCAITLARFQGAREQASETDHGGDPSTASTSERIAPGTPRPSAEHERTTPSASPSRPSDRRSPRA